MNYDETMEKATEFKVKLKGRSRNVNFNTPYDEDVAELSRISYVHNLDKNSITILTCYGGNNRLFTYVCEDVMDGIEIISAISKQMSKDYTRTTEENRIQSNSLLF